MMVKRLGEVGRGRESMGAGGGSLIVIVLRPNRYPLSPTTAAIAIPHIVMCCLYVVVRCRPHPLCIVVCTRCALSSALSPRRCCCRWRTSLCVVVVCCRWRSLCAVCRRCVWHWLVACHALLLCCCVQVARGYGGNMYLMWCSFFGRRGHTTATYPRHGYGFCMGLDLTTRTRTRAEHYMFIGSKLDF